MEPESPYAMYDFGTGYSSLSLLKNLPVDIMKKDRSFFYDNPYRDRAGILISNVMNMAKQLGMVTVAERIEEKRHIDFLRQVGCDKVQGYYYARPVPAESFWTGTGKEAGKGRLHASLKEKMKHRVKWINAFWGVFVFLSIGISGCPNPSVMYATIIDQGGSANTEELLAESPEGTAEKPNMVDERFELLSLVFRLAGKEEYGDADTEYQQNSMTQCKAFSGHEAVQYAADLQLGYDAVFNFSVHMMKD